MEHLVEVNSKCKLSINNSYVFKTDDTFKFRFKTTELPQLNINNEKYAETQYLIPPITHHALNLNELNSVQNALQEQQKNLKNISFNKIYVRGTSVWTIANTPIC